jgi:hypothetical protein
MNFQAYKDLARGILASAHGPQLVRLDCMNPVKALAAMRPVLPPRLRRTSTRELETSWRQRWGLTAAGGRVALSSGVRPLLARLFAGFARQGRRLHAPEDVYPVYLDLAAKAGVELSTFPTVPSPVLPALGLEPGSEALLVPEPLVPLGRQLSDAEADHIRAWLDEDDRRLVVLDCVYTFGGRFTKTAEELLSGGRAVLLHSLAKSFLFPDTAGFAVGPESVLGTLGHEISDDARDTAVHLLEEAPSLSEQLAGEFSRRWTRLTQATGIPSPATGYFSVSPVPFDALLACGQLAIPGTVFGASRRDWSAVTCLLTADVGPSRPSP